MSRPPSLPSDPLVEAIDDTADDWRPPTQPGRAASLDEEQVRGRASDEAGRWMLGQMRAAEERLVARLVELERAATLHARRWKLIRQILTGVGGIAFTALVAAFKIAYSSGSSSGVAEERERHTRLLEEQVRANSLELARISGELRSLNPVGALRMQGPPRKDTEPDP